MYKTEGLVGGGCMSWDCIFCLGRRDEVGRVVSGGMRSDMRGFWGWEARGGRGIGFFYKHMC